MRTEIIKHSALEFAHTNVFKLGLNPNTAREIVYMQKFHWQSPEAFWKTEVDT